MQKQERGAALRVTRAGLGLAVALAAAGAAPRYAFAENTPLVCEEDACQEGVLSVTSEAAEASVSDAMPVADASMSDSTERAGSSREAGEDVASPRDVGTASADAGLATAADAGAATGVGAAADAEAATAADAEAATAADAGLATAADAGAATGVGAAADAEAATAADTEAATAGVAASDTVAEPGSGSQGPTVATGDDADVAGTKDVPGAAGVASLPALPDIPLDAAGIMLSTASAEAAPAETSVVESTTVETNATEDAAGTEPAECAAASGGPKPVALATTPSPSIASQGSTGSKMTVCAVTQAGVATDAGSAVAAQDDVAQDQGASSQRVDPLSNWKGGHWVIRSYKKQGLQRFWVGVDGKVYKGGLIDPAWGVGKKKAGYWAYARANGTIVRGVYDSGKVVYIADNNGKLIGGTKGGWVLTKAYAKTGKKERYYIDPALHGAIEGYQAKKGKVWAHYTLPGKGYVLRSGSKRVGRKVYLANAKGKLASGEGWRVTGTYTKGDLQRYYLVGDYVRVGHFTVGKHHYYGTEKGYVLRGALKVGSWTLLADNDGRLATKRGWVTTKAYAGSKQRYYLEKCPNGYTAARNGPSSRGGYRHYTIAGKGYVSRNSFLTAKGSYYVTNDKGKMERVSERQYRMVRSAWSTPATDSGLCALWVTNVGSRAGFGYQTEDACDMYDMWCHSSSRSQLKPGMIVAVRSHPHTTAGSIWGHVGIYVGGTTLLDSVSGEVRRCKLSEWLSYYGATVTPKWGWYRGNSLT